MLDKKDAQWWVLEAQKHPESAVDLVRMLADRLAFLDKQNEELRGELIALRRRGKAESADMELAALRQRIHELEEALRQNGAEGRLLVYARDRIEANLPLSAAREAGLGRELPADVALLRCNPAARLFIVTEESRLFALALADLPEPAPGESAAPLGNPANVAAILDAAAFEQCRFLVLLTRSGHVYSLLAGTINQIARRGDKLIRNLIPEDPVVAAVPTHNGDLLAISAKGRWTRFPEKTVAGAGSLVMGLPKGDSLIGIVSLPSDTALTFLSAEGQLYSRPSGKLAARKAPGASAGQLFRGPDILGVTTGQELLILTRRGKVLTVQMEKLLSRAQAEDGAPVPGLEEGDSVLAFAGY